MKTLVRCCWYWALFLMATHGLAQNVTAPVLFIRQLGGDQVELSWSSTAAGAILEEASTLADSTSWQPLETLPVLRDEQWTVTLTGGAVSRFLRLRQALTSVEASSPASGETGVAVTRETIVHFSAPLAADVVLGANQFYAGVGGRRLLSRVELSGDRRRATLFYLEPLPGSTRVTVVFDGTGVKDFLGVPLDADGDGLPGGQAIITFDTLSLTPLANTAVIGTVYASELIPGGGTGTNAINKPLAGVTVTVDGMEQSLRAVTDVNGRFSLRPVPPGRFFVHIDGRTVTNLPVGIRYPDQAYYPYVGKAWDAEAGVTNNLAGGTGTVFLPLITAGTLQPVSVSRDTTISFPPSVISSNPALAGVSITVPANSLFNDNGTRGGRVGIAPVPPNRLPGPLPPGLEMPLVITVQTDGGLNFDQPAPICFPNLPDPVLGVPLTAGSKQALISFDHKKGVWEAVGTMTVSADGKFVCTDSGSGIRQPGWHGVGPIAGGPPPPPPPPPRCESDEAQTQRRLIALQKHIHKQGQLCGCKEDEAALDRCLHNCNVLLEACTIQAEARTIAERIPCRECGPFKSAHPCGTEANRRERSACYDRMFRKGVRERSQCYTDQVECSDICQDCWSILFQPARTFARLAAGNTPVELIMELGTQIEDLLRPYAEGDGLIPENVLAQLDQLGRQADAIAGGDAAAFLQAYVGGIAREFGHTLEDFDTGNAPEYPVLYVAKIFRRDGVLMLRGSTGPFGQYSLFVPRDGVLAEVSFYDSKTGRYASIRSNPPGSKYLLPRFTLLPLSNSERDSDLDGLADVVEDVYGTDSNKADTDGDGIPDGAEVAQGTQPLDGLVAQTGVIATVKTVGAALDIWTGNNLALLAEGTSGVSVMDISNARRPTIIAHVTTPGSAQRVAAAGDFALVATANAGVVVLDIAAPSTAKLLYQVNFAGAQAVAAGVGIGYAGFNSGRIISLNLRDGTILSQLNVPGSVQDLVLDGDHLYAITGDRLQVLSLVDGIPTVVGSAASPYVSTPNRRLFVGAGVAYTVHGKGYNTLDVSNPSNPILLAAGNTRQFGWRQIVANGSGLGLAAVGPNSIDDGLHEISLYDVSRPRTNDLFVTSFPTPGNARAVSIFNGLGYVADDTAGLQVINYLPYDAKGVPPTLGLTTSFSNKQAEEARLMRVTALVGDDVQVRNVEFYLDGVKSFTDAAFPFEFRFVTPRRAPGVNSFRLRARAWDTGGNSTWSEELTISLVPDATPPRVTRYSPVGGAKALRTVAAYFDGPMNPVTFNGGAIKVFSAGNDGRLGTADDLPVGGGSVAYSADIQAATLTFAAPLPEGLYRAVVTPAVTDLAGNPLSSEYSWQFRVADAVFWIKAGDGLWNEPLNWSTGTVPGTHDDVVIDVAPVDVTVTHGSGAIFARNVDSYGQLELNGGSLQIEGVLRMNRDLILNGGTLRGGKVSVADGARMLFAGNSGNTFDGVSVQGDLDLTTASARLLIRNGLTLSGAVRLDNNGAIGFAGVQTFNTGSIVFEGNSGLLSVEGGATLTLGPAMVVRGKSGTLGQPVFIGGNSKLINQGRISADVAGGTLTLRASVFENRGTLEGKNGGAVSLLGTAWSNAGIVAIDGGVLTLDGSFENTGAIQANAATVNLDGDFTLARLGVFQRTGGTVNLRSVLSLGGGTLALDATTGSWTMNGGILRNGTVTESAGARMLFAGNSGNTFDGVTVQGDLDLTTASARLLIRNGLTLSGTVRLDNNGAIGFAGVQTFNTGSIVFEGNSGLLSVEGGATLTLGPAMLVRGKSGTVGQPVFIGGNGKLINQGQISADVAGGTLTIRASVFENSGTLEGKNGGAVSLLGAAWSNAGTVAIDGGALTLDGSFDNTGTIQANGATVNLDGDFTLARLGVFQRTGGTVNLRSVLPLGGGTLALDATTGSWTMNGGILRNGTVTESAGARMLFAGNSGNTFDGVTVQGDLDLTTASARLLIRNGLTLSGTVRLNNNGAIGFAGVQTFNTGSIVFEGNNGLLSVEGGATLTLGPAMVVRGKSGTLGQPVFIGGNSKLINQGRISADVAGGTLTIRAGAFENVGNLEEKNGGRIVIIP